MAQILPNLAGGGSVADLDQLEANEGLVMPIASSGGALWAAPRRLRPNVKKVLRAPPA